MKKITLDINNIYNSVTCFFRQWKGLLLIILLLTGSANSIVAQRPPPPALCDTAKTPGTLPNTAIPICDKGVYYTPHPFRCIGGQVRVPNHCRLNPLSPPEDIPYDIFSPVYYKFKCYKSGTFGFTIRPASPYVNLDWQLYDITNTTPLLAIRSSQNVIAGNWSPIEGITGTEIYGLPFVICKPQMNSPLSQYSGMPDLIAEHEYLLLIANSRLNTEDYTLTIEGGTADIKDPIEPHLDKAIPECIGTEIIVKLNKEVRCSSLTLTGSEFTILPAGPAILSARPLNCNGNLGFTELVLTLSSPLTDGNYQLVIKNGTDANTIIDFCNTPIPINEQTAFSFVAPRPILADSIGNPDCVPDSIKLYFPKLIDCSSIAPNGTNFLINGPAPVTIRSAAGKCTNGKTEYVIIKFNSPIRTKGNYVLTLKTADDGSAILDECGEEPPPQNINFAVADTVNANFTYNMLLGCQRDTLTFSHPGGNDVNKWMWKFNDKLVATQNHTLIWPAKSDNEIELIVSNSGCKDTAAITIKLDNEVKAIFDMPSVICPDDKLEVLNKTEGVVDVWRWNFDISSTSNLKDPTPFLMPSHNREAYYTVKLVAYNNTIGCSDSTRKTLTVLDNCSGSVPTGFTPNNDGRNDYFSPHNAVKADNYEFKVFNRMGQLIFHTRNWQAKWDGMVNGVVQTTGVYVWMLSYTHRDTGKPVFQKGIVTLIR